MRVGLGTARAARAAGFEVEDTHPAEHARFVFITWPHGSSTGQFGAARIEQTATFASGGQCAEALVNYFQDALVNEKSCSFGAELAAKRQFSCNNRSANRLGKY